MPTGLRTQDIQCVKDALIVETADLLGVSVGSCDPSAHITHYIYRLPMTHGSVMGVSVGSCDPSAHITHHRLPMTHGSVMGVSVGSCDPSAHITHHRLPMTHGSVMGQTFPCGHK